ncbi:hypothetical protein GW17_00032718 [Ensete ventricosum]|nr:hypothetical protein GW17_00032718 [Ensete ventricosum]
MATASTSEVEREGCQTSDVDINYRAGPESSDPRMKITLAMLYFFIIIGKQRSRLCRRGVDLQLRLRKKAVDGVGICYRLIARRNLLCPLYKAPRNDGQWPLQVLLAERTKAAGGTIPASGCRSHLSQISRYRAKGRVRRAWGWGWRPVLRRSFDGGQRFDGGKLVEKNLMPEMGYMYTGGLLLLLLLQIRKMMRICARSLAQKDACEKTSVD